MKKTTILRAVLAVLCALFAASASASPTWKFEDKALDGTETILGGAFESSHDDPGPDH